LNILSTQQSRFSSQNHLCYADNRIKLNEIGIFKKCRKQGAMSLLLYFRTSFYRVPPVVRLLVARFYKSNFSAIFVYWLLVILLGLPSWQKQCPLYAKSCIFKSKSFANRTASLMQTCIFLKRNSLKNNNL